MATDIVGSLFGVSPEMYQEDRNRQGMRDAIAMAQLDPMQYANAAIQAGAGRAAGGFAGLMGVEDPQMRLISQRNALAKQIDMNDPESIMRGAQMAAQSGDTVAASTLADYARKAASDLALIQQRLRERQGADPIQQLIRAGKHTPQSIDLYSKSGNIKDLEFIEKPNKTAVVGNSLVDAVTGFVLYEGPNVQKYSEFAKTLIDAGLKPGTEPFQNRMLEYANKKVEGAGKGTGNVTIGGINVDTGAASKAAGKIVGENVANIENQFSLETAYKDALSLLNKGIYGGAFGPEQAAATKYSLGLLGNQKKLENTEVFMANIGEIVIPRLMQFGGNDSNEELKYLQNVVAGNQRLEPESMKRILTSAEKKVQNNIKRLNLQTQAAKGGTELPITPVTNAPAITPTKRYNLQTRQLEVIKGD
jgi:hypothetical protein